MRIAVVDENAVRAAIIEEGLAIGGHDVFVLATRQGLARAIEEINPDVILIDLGNPSRDVLEEYFAVSRAVARPIAMFVDQSDEESTFAAVDAGVSAYIVDGFKKERIKPIVDLAVRRFQAFAKLQEELAEARGQAAERKIVDAAKAILMARRNIGEPEAYKLLRSHAMQSNRRIAEVAEALVTADNLMGGAL